MSRRSSNQIKSRPRNAAAHLTSRRVRLFSGVSVADATTQEDIFARLESIQNASDNMNLMDLTLSVQTASALFASPYNSIGKLCSASDAELLRLPGIGRARLAEIKEQLALNHLCLMRKTEQPTPPSRPRPDIGQRGANLVQATKRLAVHPHEAWIDQKDYQSIVLRIPCKLSGLNLIHAINAALAAAKTAVQSAIDKEGA